MTKKRKQPFGYAMQNGKIVINESEAALVRDIFIAYKNGNSYSQIVKILNKQPIPYFNPGTPWAKTMVARILSNTAYQGSEQYPAVITQDEYQDALSKKPITGACLEQFQDFKAIRHMVKCSNCGSPLKMGNNRYRNVKWSCPSCGVFASRTADTMVHLAEIINHLIETPEQLHGSPRKKVSEAIELRRKEDAFACEINNSAFDEQKARIAAILLASARYDVLGSEEYETRKIKYILSHTQKSEELDTTLLREIADEIIIHSDGKIGLKMKNGQIIERNESV